MNELIESLGYFGAFLGAVLEGEILFLTAIQMALLGYMNFYGVLIAVFLGAVASDWAFYYAGRTQGRKFIKGSARLNRSFDRMDTKMERFDHILLFSYRFMWGFRVVLPVLFGARGIAPWRFGLFGALAALVWVGLYGTLGYFFAELVIQKIEIIQHYFWILIIILALVITLLYWRSKKRQKKEAKET